MDLGFSWMSGIHFRLFCAQFLESPRHRMMHDNDGKGSEKPTKDGPQMYRQGKNLVIMAFSLYSTLFLQTNMFKNICWFIA